MDQEPRKPAHFNFEAKIVKRRRLRLGAIITGLLAIGGLGYGIWSFLEYGAVPFLERLISQLGLVDYTEWIEIGLVAVLSYFIIRTLYYMFRKKKVLGGSVSFDEENLRIEKSGEKYVIPQSELQHLQFELLPLNEPKTEAKPGIKGGNFMKIPSQKGMFNCELDIQDKEQLNQLLEMVEFLKIEHDVDVKVKM